MERQICSHCKKYTGFSRNWTFGKFFTVWMLCFCTMGLSLLLLPWMMPKYCINCGAKK